MDKRVLVVSNNCFSYTDSNGRTLGMLFKEWNISKLAQFYIQNKLPDTDVCNNFYRVTDKQMMKSFFHLDFGSKVQATSSFQNNKNVNSKKKKLWKYILRTLLWNFYTWWNDDFDKWLNNFKPEVVLLQAGDSIFMYKIARKIANKYNSNLVVYNTEGYYFKDYKYIEQKKATLLSKIYIKWLRREYDKTYIRSNNIIYNCEELKNAYDEILGSGKSSVIYCSSNIEKSDNTKNDEKVRFVYLGNLGIGRHYSLIEIGKSLQKINKKYKLEVYGKASNDIIEDFNKCLGIDYKGFVSYDDVKKIMSRANYLVHVESFKEYYVKDLQYAFSTKIADCLSSGKPFIVFSPLNMASSKYLLKNNAALVITDKEKLEDDIKEYLKNNDLKKFHIANALACSRNNHNYKKNSDKFKSILNS